MIRLRLSVAVYVLLLCLSSTAAFAVQVQVDPGNFEGQWSVQGVTGFVTGSQTVSLDPGSYAFFAASVGFFFVDVASNETVSVQNGVSAEGGFAELTFNTTTLLVDPAAFTGDWNVSRVVGFSSGSRSFEVVPGTSYLLFAGSEGAFVIDVAGDGSVSVVNGISGTGGLGTLTFDTRTIAIDPGAFAGEWKLNFVTEFATGPTAVAVVPGVKLVVAVAGIGSFSARVMGDGSVTVDNGISAIGGQESLTFNTAPVLIDAADFPGAWILSRLGEHTFGNASFSFVPGTRYLIFVGGGNAANFTFDVTASGSVIVNNGTSAIGALGSLTFNTETVSFDPGNFTGSWRIVGTSEGPIFETIGSASVPLVAGLGYALHPGNQAQQTFTVASPCSINPSQLVFNLGTFAIGCGAPDTDQDGVPDDTDNCPFASNLDQVDQDLDGLGDECDEDLDGDTVTNGLDNCPAVANADQADLDFDGTGDACDLDTDGDSVPNDNDNCPAVANTDQANSDADLLGDACDPDDDNDGIDDLADNCRLTANPDQADFDGDGEGDLCDGDADGDGVVNGGDLCAQSPAGQPVDAGGCTGAQSIGRRCLREDFVQHGQYVRCVAHAANDSVQQGLISPQEKSRFIEAAAHGD